MKNERPWAVLARLDVDRVARWWIRRRDGRYEEWEPTTPGLARRKVPPHRLAIPKRDWSEFVGDARAIIEIRNARLAFEDRGKESRDRSSSERSGGGAGPASPPWPESGRNTLREAHARLRHTPAATIVIHPPRS